MPESLVLKLMLFLMPVYVSLFWAFTLAMHYHKSKCFLAKFMFLTFLIALGEFAFFTPIPDLYYWINPLSNCAWLMLPQTIYVYIRLQTIESTLSWKQHGKYLTVPFIFFLLNLLGIFITPSYEYKVWVMNHNVMFQSFGIHYLNIFTILINVVFLLEASLGLIGIIYLVKTYRIKSEEYYAEPSSPINVLPGNTTFWILLLAQVSISLALIGIFPEKMYYNYFWAIIYVEVSVILFIIGWKGITRKPLKPFQEIMVNKDEDTLTYVSIAKQQHNQILQIILSSFSEEKFFLKRELTIDDVAQKVVTNRTYVSKIINEHSGQNFCSFVNDYRINEMKRILKSDTNISLRQLAEVCGFGSVDSMKRVTTMKTGMNVYLLRKTIQEESSPRL